MTQKKLEINIDEITNNIREAMYSLDGEEIAKIHNDICNENIEYQGDSVWLVKESDIAY